jgi:hypothetical protein
MGIIRICLLFISLACVSLLAASAQETVKVNRVGFLGITHDSHRVFLKGLAILAMRNIRTSKSNRDTPMAL